MNIPILHSDDWMTAMLLLTFVPMITTAVFSVLCFHRAGYGPLGKVLVAGFVILVGSLFLGLMFSIEREPIYRGIAGITRIVGWSLIAIGFIIWYVELDRSLP